MKSLLVITLLCCVASLCDSAELGQNEREAKQKPKPIKPVTSGITTYASTILDLTTLGGKRYFFSKRQKFNWIESAAFCRLYGMDLASIETREEDDLIVRELERIELKGTWVWTSGNKIGRGAYRWANGQPFDHENWYTGQPDNFAGDHCAITWGGKWHDLTCLHPTNFICEEPFYVYTPCKARQADS